MSNETRKGRIAAIDAARCVALIGMFSVHLTGDFNDQYEPNVAWMVASGRSAALFAVLAGVAMVLSTQRVDWNNPTERRQARLAIAIRATLIASIGLSLAYVNNPSDLDVYIILPYYALAFLVAMPLLRRSNMAIGISAVVSLIFGPLLALAFTGLAPTETNFTLTSAAMDPLGFFVQIAFSGAYPVVCYVSYVFVGMLLARWGLRSAAHLKTLLGSGVILAVAAYSLGFFILRLSDGFDTLVSYGLQKELSLSTSSNLINWVGEFAPENSWSLARVSPHSNMAFEMLHNIGVAMAVIGGLGLMLRSRRLRQIARPLLAAGSMPLTIYVCHVLTISIDPFSNIGPVALITSVIAVLGFATLWRRRFGQGPLERLVALIINKATRRNSSSTPATSL